MSNYDIKKSVFIDYLTTHKLINLIVGESVQRVIILVVECNMILNKNKYKNESIIFHNKRIH